MQFSKNCGASCCISNWHRESDNKLYDDEINNPNVSYSLASNKRATIYGVGFTERLNENDNSVNSGPNGKRKFKDFLESNLQHGGVLNLLIVSRLLSEWRKSNEIKNSFVMELIDFTRLCGVKRNVTYKELFELLSKLFESKLKMKKIDNSTFKKFDLLASKCLRLINIPQLLNSIIMVLTKFNRLPDKILNELTTPDLHLFPSFLSFYKLAPIKLRQQMWLKRPDWFVYEILPFIMLFTKLSSNVDCCSINNTKYHDINGELNSMAGIDCLLERFKTDIDRNGVTNIRKYIEDYVFEFANTSSSSCSNCIEKHVQYSDSVDSIFSFISRIKALYTSCVELEHDEIELFGESCKCLAFNYMDSFEFYKAFFQLQKNEQLHSLRCVDMTVGNINSCPDSTCKSTKNTNHMISSGKNSLQGSLGHNKNTSLSNCTTTNLTICGNILKLGRIVAYISHCIGGYKELYIYFVSTVKQIYLDSLSHNIGSKAIQGDDLKSTQEGSIQYESISFDENSHFFSKHTLQTHIDSSNNEKVNLEKSRGSDNSESSKHEVETNKQKSTNPGKFKSTCFNKSSNTKQFNYQFEHKLNNFSGEPLLATLRIFVALRIFYFENKTNWSEDDDVKVGDFDDNVSGNKTTDLNSEKIIVNSSYKSEYSAPLTISECDPVAWPCINIIGNVLRDGFSSNKSQELLVNVSSTLVIKSTKELADIAFVFSEPHFLFICSEFILETSILTMFHSSMDVQLVLNPQRRKIPIGLISLGLNSVFLAHKNRNTIIESSSFLNVTSCNSIINGISLNKSITSKTCNSQISNFCKPQYTDSSVLSNIHIQSNLKKEPNKLISNDSTPIYNNNGDSNSNFAIRFDALLNLLTSFNIDGNSTEDKQFESNNEATKYINSAQVFEINNNFNSTSINQIGNVYSKLLSNLNKLNCTIFTTFLPLIDRYLELSISTEEVNMSNLGKEIEVSCKSKKSEVLKFYRNELMEYIGSLYSKEYCHSSDMSLKFIRLISSSLFFTGMKPTFSRHENSQTQHFIQNNIIGLYYGHFHETNNKIDQNVLPLYNQVPVPLLPSCINLSIRLLEVSFCSDWLNQLFLKSILGLLHTYPRISGKSEKGHLENSEVKSMNYNNTKSAEISLLASIPRDIVQGLFFRIVLPSIRDPLISSSEINVVNEIIANRDILTILDNKTRKLCIERLWFRSPFQFVINYESIIGGTPNEPSQRLHIKDIHQYLIDSSSEKKEIKEINLLIPYKVMVWEHHFIGNNDAYFVFIKWLVYFQRLCTILDKENQISNKFILINDLLRSSDNKLKL
ncbi:hypothetical protein RS030_1184 [Cryptosporidium xiaoi]|uniref:Uncharacterized protein n=1 Tax=Cryptosporidium xiaoi TaxID=659607 RepID=A0AAV9XZE2_9CRYT